MTNFGKSDKRFRFSSSGFSVLEAVIGVTILIVFFMFHINSYIQVDKARKAQSESYSRMRVFQGLINIMGMHTTLRATGYHAGYPDMFHICLFGSAGSCPNPTTKRNIRLLLPPLMSTAGYAELSGPFTGTPAAPMFYSNDGEVCDSTTTTCPADEFPIAVSTQWSVVCPPRADVTYVYPHIPWTASDGTDHMNPEGIDVPTTWCSRAHYIKIYYRFFPRPTGQQFKEVTGTLWVSAPAASFAY